MVGAASRLGLVALLATACLGPLEAPPGAIVDPASCDQLGTAVGAVGPAERKLLGAAAPYPADGLLRARTDELAGSLTARREVAWAAVARLLAPAPFAIEPGAGAPAMLPTWHTWYDGDEVRRLFDHLVRTRTAEQLRTRAPFTDGELDGALAWSPTAVDELPTWPAERWSALLASLTDASAVHGVGGLPRVGYSPAAARHLLASYPEIVACHGQPAPPAVTDAPMPGPRRVVREVMTLASCQRRQLGPYFVGADETLIAEAAPTGDGQGVAAVATHLGQPGAAPACQATRCEVTGPAAVWLEAIGTRAGDVAVTVDYLEANPSWAPCLAAPFPLDAAIVKAEWRRAELEIEVAVHDTSGPGLAALVDDTWPTTTPMADPGADTIYTLGLPEGGARYRLTGLHVMTKELDHWLWVTLWWSDRPDEDFGADRPAAIAALPGPWRNYKMCVVTAFTEDAVVPGGTAASLAAALAQVHQQAGPSYCSNPYLEQGEGNARTNCIGCHQHGGTTVTNPSILGDEVTYPGNGRLQVRNNFPADYSWQTSHGGLGQTFVDELSYWSQSR